MSSSMQQLMDKVPRHIVFPYPRTVILLAGTTASASTSCPAVKSMADVSTSVFSQSIEAITEYCRIMWDLFPVDKAMVALLTTTFCLLTTLRFLCLPLGVECFD